MRHTRHPSFLVLIVPSLLVTGFATRVRAQAQPGSSPGFFGSGVSSFAPQISTISSRTLLDAQAVVSADLKYVQLNMRPVNTGLLSLVPFGFQTAAGAGGLVGGAGGGSSG